MMKSRKDSFSESNFQEQGCQMTCFYCQEVYPHLKGPKCPYCSGTGSFFQPAQMMSKELSQETITRSLAGFFQRWDESLEISELSKEKADALKKSILGLIKEICIYNFDFKETLISLVHRIDQFHDLAP